MSLLLTNSSKVSFFSWATSEAVATAAAASRPQARFLTEGMLNMVDLCEKSQCMVTQIMTAMAERSSLVWEKKAKTRFGRSHAGRTVEFDVGGNSRHTSYILLQQVAMGGKSAKRE